MSIPFTSLPTFNELFLDYINNFETVRKYYEYDYKNFEDFFKCIETKKETHETGKNFFRNDVCDILNTQNRSFKSGIKTFDNLNLLKDHNTFAVVTGQQLGLLTGPFYTILKIINTVQLSKKLNDKFSDYKFVPVFWLEADDHDFQEINNINIISKDNEIKNIKYYEKGLESDKYLKPSGNLIFDEYIDTFVNELEGSLNKTDFTESIFTMIRDSYRPEINFKSSFTGFVNSLLGDRGIIFIDPSDPEIKKLLKPVFETELRTSPAVCEIVINTTVELEESYQAQVKPKAINIFYIHEGNRYLIEPRENSIYALKHSRTKFTKEELFDLLETNPERFSWNVVTRPICQDYLLPTVAYVGGPSEVSYFAQFKGVYKFFNVAMPVVYPRTSVTLIEGRVKNFLEKYNISFEELFNEKELSRKLIKNISDTDSEEIFSNMKEELTALFYTYEKELVKIDPVNSAAFSKRNQQYIESLNVAKEKFITSQSRQNEVISNQLQKVLLYVFPGENLQERVYNIVYYLNKYSIELIDTMFNDIKIDDHNHQLINASPQVSVN
ncbi:MAG: bacillithiol biosynthesis cysteine-adding enzyme BshC [Ignavibacteria bacterium]